MSAVIRALKPVSPLKGEDTVAPPPRRKRATARGWLRALLREPPVHFIALGALLWATAHYWNAYRDRYTIEIGPTERARIGAAYVQQFGQAPTPPQLQGLIDRRIREEIFLREGLALGLDKDDEIVRRRIVQKVEFLETDLSSPAPPAPTALARWFEDNKARYLTLERIAFSQVYFSPDRGGEEAAKRRALHALRRLFASRLSRAPSLGDPFPGPMDVSALAPEEAVRLFGDSQLSNELFKLPMDRWSGPYRSGYGWHLLYVTARLPRVLPPLAEIRDRVLADYLDEKLRLANANAFEKLRAKYTVRVD